MRSYETLIMEKLKGETPKAKYEYLLSLFDMVDGAQQQIDDMANQIGNEQERRKDAERKIRSNRH